MQPSIPNPSSKSPSTTEYDRDARLSELRKQVKLNQAKKRTRFILPVIQTFQHQSSMASENLPVRGKDVNGPGALSDAHDKIASLMNNLVSVSASRHASISAPASRPVPVNTKTTANETGMQATPTQPTAATNPATNSSGTCSQKAAPTLPKRPQPPQLAGSSRKSASTTVPNTPQQAKPVGPKKEQKQGVGTTTTAASHVTLDDYLKTDPDLADWLKATDYHNVERRNVFLGPWRELAAIEKKRNEVLKRIEDNKKGAAIVMPGVLRPEAPVLASFPGGAVPNLEGGTYPTKRRHDNGDGIEDASQFEKRVKNEHPGEYKRDQLESADLPTYITRSPSNYGRRYGHRGRRGRGRSPIRQRDYDQNREFSPGRQQYDSYTHGRDLFDRRRGGRGGRSPQGHSGRSPSYYNNRRRNSGHWN
jgi:hypothetical protein